MIVFLSHRRLKPGSYEDYRAAWQPEAGTHEAFERSGIPERVYHARSLKDPDEVISFGIADIGAGDIGRLMAAYGDEAAEERRQERMAQLVESTGVDTIFEVIEELLAGEEPDPRIVFLTHRTLKPGSFAAFRAAWGPEGMEERMEAAGIRERAYHARALRNPDEIISFGIADLGPEDLERFRDAFADLEDERQRAMAEHVASTGVDAIFEILEVIRIGEDAKSTA